MPVYLKNKHRRKLLWTSYDKKPFARVYLDMLHKFACVNEHVH